MIIVKRLIIIIAALCFFAAHAYAQAQEKNVSVKQVGNRVLFEYDLEGDEKETDINITITAGGKTYTNKELHLEGDIEKVKPGKGKRIWWNILLNFPRGVSTDVAWELTAGGGAAFTDAVTGMEFVFVKGGCFDMGDNFGDGDSNNEKPVHEVCVDDFYMGKYEVTQGQWQTIMGSNPSNFKNCGNDCPVEQVSWNDIQNYIQKLNSRTGKNYKLPTEAEWEYAARSGGKREKWSGTSNESELGNYAWYEKNSSSKTHPVGQKKPNGLGLYDMSGNVWEWVQDWYGEKYYGESSKNNPTGPYSGSNRVLRGGAWYLKPGVVRAASRYGFDPGNWFDLIGCRLSVSAQR